MSFCGDVALVVQQLAHERDSRAATLGDHLADNGCSSGLLHGRPAPRELSRCAAVPAALLLIP